METTENKNQKSHPYCGHKRKAGWIVLGIVGFTAFAFLFGAVVMWLWNWLMPTIFHLTVITYWQAFGLAILAKVLFGNFHHGHHPHGHHRFGPWRHRNYMYERNNCRDYNGAKWGYYDQFWDEEGEKAFNEYLKRKSETPENQE